MEKHDPCLPLTVINNLQGIRLKSLLGGKIDNSGESQKTLLYRFSLFLSIEVLSLLKGR